MWQRHSRRSAIKSLTKASHQYLKYLSASQFILIILRNICLRPNTLTPFALKRVIAHGPSKYVLMIQNIELNVRITISSTHVIT